MLTICFCRHSQEKCDDGNTDSSHGMAEKELEKFFKYIGFFQILLHLYLSPHFYPRINVSVNQINSQIRQNDCKGKQHEHTLEQGVISL